MDLRFSREEEAFRQELRAFLKKEMPPDREVLEEEDSEDWQFTQAMRKKLAQRGWLAMGWPREYGGMGASPLMQTIFNEEMAYHRAPGRDIFGVIMLGPAVIHYGTEEQKRNILPGIARGEVVWCQGFSEPNAGSDLASLQTRAIEDGDDFVINGQKIWTSGAHRADRMFVLCRTDTQAPKHKGISFLLLDMKSPGITIRPLIQMTGMAGFNEVFFDNVRTSKKNIVGEKNQGWYVAAALLDFERSGVAMVAGSKRTLEELIDFARETKENGVPLAENPIHRHRLAELAIELEVARMMSYNISWIQGQGQIPNKEASIIKVFGMELNQRLARTGMQLLGLYGPLDAASKRACLKGRINYLYLRSLGNTIEGGTSEIQRNIIAMRGLGLPRQ